LQSFGEFQNSHGEKKRKFWAFSFWKALGVYDAVKGDLPFDLRFRNLEVRVINVGFFLDELLGLVTSRDSRIHFDIRRQSSLD